MRLFLLRCSKERLENNHTQLKRPKPFRIRLRGNAAEGLRHLGGSKSQCDRSICLRSTEEVALAENSPHGRHRRKIERELRWAMRTKRKC